MKLTKHTDYAFRTLIYLASMEQPLTNIRQIANEFSVSRSHLMKVVNELASHGWIEAVRGKNGGIRLGVAAEDISVKEVVEVMEPNIEPVNCYDPLCAIVKNCGLKPILWRARDAYMDYLARYSVADLLNKETAQVLHIQ